jgi:mono/diheme cytochrome c family protein
MNRLGFLAILPGLIPAWKILPTRAMAQASAVSATGAAAWHRVLLNTYCADCHNSRARTGGLALDGLDLRPAADDAQIREKALRKLRGHLMPPPGALSRRRKMTFSSTPVTTPAMSRRTASGS